MARPTMIREWRKFRGLTLEKLAAEIAELLPPGEGARTAASLSRIETGKQPYSQPILEAIADVLTVEPSDLIRRAPTTRDQFELVAWVQALSPEQRRTALRMLKAMVDAA